MSTLGWEIPNDCFIGAVLYHLSITNYHYLDYLGSTTLIKNRRLHYMELSWYIHCLSKRAIASLQLMRAEPRAFFLRRIVCIIIYTYYIYISIYIYYLYIYILYKQDVLNRKHEQHLSIASSRPVASLPSLVSSRWRCRRSEHVWRFPKSWGYLKNG